MGETVENEYLRPQQAEDTVKWVVQETFAVLTRRAQLWPAWRSASGAAPDDISKDTYAGYCGDAQSFIDLTLRDYGMDSKPFATQTLPHYKYGHVAQTSTFETTEGPKIYLIDPTFRQFQQQQAGNRFTAPGLILANQPGGEEMVEALCTKGYIELTPERAFSYTAAFNDGISPYATPDAAMSFFTRPIESPMNRYFTRDALLERGIKV